MVLIIELDALNKYFIWCMLRVVNGNFSNRLLGKKGLLGNVPFKLLGMGRRLPYVSIFSRKKLPGSTFPVLAVV
jgi:hypothetical protein